jgi:hypothetical protein
VSPLVAGAPTCPLFLLPLVMISHTGPTRPIHIAAYKGDLGEVTRLLDSGEPVDPRDSVSLPLPCQLIIKVWEHRSHECLSQWSLKCDRSAPGQGSWDRSSEHGHLTRSSHLIIIRLDTPLSCMPVARVTPQRPLCSWTWEQIFIFGTRSPHSLFLFDCHHSMARQL